MNGETRHGFKNFSAVRHELDGLIRAVFGPRACVARVEIAKDEPDYSVLLVNLQRPTLRVVIKLAGANPPYPCPFGRSAAIYRRVGQAGNLRMPYIYGVDESFAHYPFAWMIKEHIAGVEWAGIYPSLGGAARKAALASIGEAAAHIHSLRYPAYGELNGAGGLDQAQGGVEAVRARASRWIAGERSREMFLNLLEKQAGLFAGTNGACMCHEDLHCYNLLFKRAGRGWRLATVLDFDKAWAGFPDSDLARLELWEATADVAVLDGYVRVRPLPGGYAERRPIFQLLWCLEYAENTPRHLRDTDSVCRQLGIPFTGRFE